MISTGQVAFSCCLMRGRQVPKDSHGFPAHVTSIKKKITAEGNEDILRFHCNWIVPWFMAKMSFLFTLKTNIDSMGKTNHSKSRTPISKKWWIFPSNLAMFLVSCRGNVCNFLPTKKNTFHSTKNQPFGTSSTVPPTLGHSESGHFGYRSSRRLDFFFRIPETENVEM